ncbi:hypothetical protein ACG33_07190 [Steroidobacter denitrificans]|uniref:Uncharacterized protein n=2 Tax=Steroidobacter denitrificans TaxID=465721 RepID=A0A127FBB4_STEDE|nr:hypothetical protein ACG33_07190 [Steroidobacter denitrificans]
MTALVHGEFDAVTHGTELINLRRNLKRARYRVWSAYAMLGFLGLVLGGYAQFFPFYARRRLPDLVDAMTSAKDEESLERVRDVMLLTRQVMHVLRPGSIFKSKASRVIEDLDEHLDSIDYVLGNRSRLDASMLQLDQCA